MDYPDREFTLPSGDIRGDIHDAKRFKEPTGESDYKESRRRKANFELGVCLQSAIVAETVHFIRKYSGSVNAQVSA